MQNKYVGDIGDFGKYGLLREIFGRPEEPGSGCGLRLGVAWYLSEDKQGSGGNLTDYPKLRTCDPCLYNVLQRLIKTGNRKVAEVQRNKILPDTTLYHSLPLSSSTRARWFKDALKETEDADVVFVDPDNGVASENTPLGSRQHVLPYELDRFFERGQSLVIYHHLARTDALTQINGLSERLRGELNLSYSPSALWYHRGTARAYFIVPHERHRDVIEKRLTSFEYSLWTKQGHFERVT